MAPKYNPYVTAAGYLVNQATPYVVPYLKRQLYNSAVRTFGGPGSARPVRGFASMPGQGKRVKLSPNAFMNRVKESVKKARQRRRTRGAPDSKSGGFFKRPAVRIRKTAPFSMAKQGSVYNIEHGGTFEAAYCGFIGHTSAPVSYALTIACSAIVKKIHEQLKCFYTDEVDELAFGGKITTVEFAHKAFPEQTATVASLTTTGSSTVKSVIDWLELQISNLFGQSQQAMLESITCFQNGGTAQYTVPVQMNLRQCYITLESKSSLKIQNRSKNALGSEADEVDNVPLYGKQYSGKGSGVHPIKKGSNIALFAWPATGVIQATGTAQFMKEPPNGYEFEEAVKVGKAKLEPGEIKTSVIYDRTSCHIDKYFAALIRGTGALVPAYPRLNIGKFRLFALEKMIETNNELPINMLFAYENNTKLACSIRSYQPKVQVQRNILI